MMKLQKNASFGIHTKVLTLSAPIAVALTGIPIRAVKITESTRNKQEPPNRCDLGVLKFYVGLSLVFKFHIVDIYHIAVLNAHFL